MSQGKEIADNDNEHNEEMEYVEDIEDKPEEETVNDNLIVTRDVIDAKCLRMDKSVFLWRMLYS